MRPKIYILLPVYNRKEVTERFIDCLSIQTYSNFHLVLIDDGSTDNTEEMVKTKISNLTILKGKGDWWWSGSLQRGLEWLKENNTDNSALILFINDDVCFSPDYLEQACEVMTNKQGVLVLSRFKSADNIKIMETGVCADLHRLSFKVAEEGEKINCLSTRGLFVYWKDILAIGDFHPTLLPHYLSDYEYTIRAHKKGFRCETSANILIEPNDETTGYHKISAENFVDFLKKYFSKKSASNPIYWTSFVFLTSELLWTIPNFLRVWGMAAKAIFQFFSASRKRCSHQ